MSTPSAPAFRALWIAAAVVLALRLLFVFLIPPDYGFHRDELLYLAMADHLDPWRMQFPPFIAIAGRLSLAVFGETSLLAARVPAALGATALTVVIMETARRLGASAAGLCLAAVGVLAAPIFVRPGVLFQPVVFDQLWYAIAALGLLRAARDDDPRTGWLLVGLGLGLGGLTKFSVAFYAVGLAVAVLLSSRLRASLRTRWPWMAAALALSIALPSITGQIAHDWPFLTQARQLRGSQLARIDYAEYFLEQPLMLSGSVLLVVAAAYGLVRLPALRDARPLGVAAMAIVTLLLVMKGKGYYAGPAYAPLLAVGAVALELLARRGGAREGFGGARRQGSGGPEGTRRWLLPAAFGTLGIGAIALLPAGVPLLEPAPMSRYALALGVTRTNYGTTLSLPQDYADMTPWRAQVTAVAEAWQGLDEADRASTQIVGVNYGRLGALARYGREHGLPYPVGRHGDFWAWGAGPASTRHLLVLGESPDALAPLCRSAREIARVRNPLAVEEERDVPITFCRDLRESLPAIWRRLGPEWG